MIPLEPLSPSYWLAVAAVVAGITLLAALAARQWMSRAIERRLIALSGDLQGLQAALDEHSIVSMADAWGTITYVNDRFCRISGYERSELMGRNHHVVNSGMHPSALFRQMWETIRAGRTWHGELCNRAKDGSLYWVDTTIVPVRDAAGDIDRYVSIRYDITERKRTSEILSQVISGHEAAERELTRAARIDRLTGLANRSVLADRLQAHVATARQEGSNHRFALLFLDFDRFKTINDSLGHNAGDTLLCEVAARLRKVLRSSDFFEEPDSQNLVARFGGDEFGVLLGKVAHAQEARELAQRLLAVLHEPYVIGEHEMQSSASIGIVMGDACSEGADALLRDADTAMYEAKRLGRGRAVLFDATMREQAARRLLMEGNLRRAIGSTQLSLVYQPIVDLETGATVSAEALLRWKDPVLGSVSPNEFIPLAEESGLIVAIGQWVLEQACRDFMGWHGLACERAPRTISVNVSRVQMNFPDDLLATVMRVIDENGMKPQQLQLEVTEREAMRDPEGFRALTQRLKAIGVLLAMDDFGTGTSSLGALRELPFDVIKIDRSFVEGLETNRDVLAVVHAAVTLVENLGMLSVAEGIETPAQAAILLSLGCRFAQGYFFSRPVDAQLLLGANSMDRNCVPALEP